jgi:hypothetical protein
MEKLMMSRPAALSFFALSATSMIALGFARPMRSASIGIGFPRMIESGREILAQRCVAQRIKMAPGQRWRRSATRGAARDRQHAGAVEIC